MFTREKHTLANLNREGEPRPGNDKSVMAGPGHPNTKSNLSIGVDLTTPLRESIHGSRDARDIPSDPRPAQRKENVMAPRTQPRTAQLSRFDDANTEKFDKAVNAGLANAVKKAHEKGAKLSASYIVKKYPDRRRDLQSAR
jgi:hypothetical protein